MPDGFEPRQELVRIDTLRELIVQCRARTPAIIDVLDRMIAECDSYDPLERLALVNVVLDRGFGKPRQQHTVQVDPVSNTNENDDTVRLYLPDNGRGTLSNAGKVIDVDV